MYLQNESAMLHNLSMIEMKSILHQRPLSPYELTREHLGRIITLGGIVSYKHFSPNLKDV
jgi:hypothetical protein